MNPTYTRAKRVRPILGKNRFSGFENTDYLYNNSLNLSVRSRISDYILPMKDVNTTDPNDYTFIFQDPKYNNKSLQTICTTIGDPSRSQDINFVPGYGQMRSYKELRTTILPKMKKEVAAKLKNISGNKAFFLEALSHYSKNVSESPTEIASDTPLVMIPVSYPLTVGEVTLLSEKINTNTSLTKDEKDILNDIAVKFEFLSLKIGKKGLTIDDYLNQAILVREIMGQTIPEAIQILCPDFDRINVLKGNAPLLERHYMVNLQNRSLQAIKYGTIATMWGRDEDLFAYLNMDAHAIAEGINVNMTNPSPAYNEFYLKNEFIRLKEIIGFSYNNISCLLTVFCHEVAHRLGAGDGSNSQLKNFPLGLSFSKQSVDMINRVVPLDKLVDAFTVNNNTFAQGYTPRLMSGVVLGEFLADFIALLVLEKYVDTLPDLKSKYDAIANSTAWACGPNMMDANHPPNSMRVNIVFLSKKLHRIISMYNNKKTYKTRAQRGPLGAAMGGGRTRKLGRKH